MSLAEFALAVGFLAGAGVTGWLYTLTDRGRTIGVDTMKANRNSRWWLSKAFLGRHWPMIVMITAYTLAFGLLAPNL